MSDTINDQNYWNIKILTDRRRSFDVKSPMLFVKLSSFIKKREKEINAVFGSFCIAVGSNSIMSISLEITIFHKQVSNYHMLL